MKSRYQLILWLFLLLWPLSANARVEKKGNWPLDERVSLSLPSVPRNEALKNVAEAAKLSLIAPDLGQEKIQVEIRDLPTVEAFEAILSAGDYEVTRSGQSVTVTAKHSGKIFFRDEDSLDRPESVMVTEPTVIEKDMVLRDVFVFDSSVTIKGTVTGSVVSFGGTIYLAETARVQEDVISFGGGIDLENGSEVGGEVAALFGKLRKGDKVKIRCSTCEDDEDPKAFWPNLFEKFFERLTGAALLWIFGALLIAGAYRRVQVLRAEIQKRPLRLLGIGIASGLGLLVLLVTLLITLVGIPLALLGGLSALVAIYLTYTVVLLAAGERLLEGRTENAYRHLALGTALWFVLEWIPVVGAILGMAATLVALGALVTTRLGTR